MDNAEETAVDSTNAHDDSVKEDKPARKKFQNAVLKATAFNGPVRLDDDMNYDDLRRLERIFNDSSGDNGLDMEQFRVAMKKTMGNHINNSDLDMIFMKVDTNCDGTVDWDEYLSYMLLEYLEKENMVAVNNEPPFPRPMVEKCSNHLESICRVTLLQAYTIRNNGKIELDDSASRYITLSKEGVLNVWNLDLVQQKSTLLDGMRNNPRAVWFTDVICMPNCNTVAVASTDYEISFYSMTSNLFQKKFQIKDLDYCALTLDYHFEYSNTKRSILLWGDSNGSVVLLRFYDNPSLVLFSSTSPSCVENKISLNNLVKGHIHNLRVAKFTDVHQEWIQELRYYVTVKGQECFISCCMRDQNSMLFADITEKIVGNPNRTVELNRKSYFNVSSGVRCISYDAEWNLIVTGSRDFNIRVWNPYVISKSTMVLKGHTMPVVQVYVRMVDHHLISVSKDKNIRIWDLRDYVCKQTIHGRNVNLGRLDVSAMFFNERRMELILATNSIGLFIPSASSVAQTKKGKDVSSHTKPISRVLYNPLFKQLVTGSEDSMISVWDLKTGTKTMQFCTDLGVEITAMAFDPTYRRLISGSRNGAISIWNFNNGAQLRSLKTTDELEVSEVIYAKHRIVAAGWNKNVSVYVDSYVDESFRRMRIRHNDDILSMDYHKLENILTTSSFDGDIFIWSLDVEAILVKFNINISILPIQGGKPGSNKKQEKPRKKSDSKSSSSTNDPIYDAWLPDTLPWVINKPKDEEDLYLENIDGETGEETIRKLPSEKAVNKIAFLQSRRSNINTAILLAATAMGYIAAWSVHQRGGLLGYFNAVKHKGEMVVAMETDEHNNILITGDSRGYIRMWEIRDYCNGSDVEMQRQNVKVEEFTNLFEGVDPKLAEAYRMQHSYLPISVPPKLQTSFRGHTKSVTSIAYIEEVGLVASGSMDCGVRLWTLNGRYIGTFGQTVPWNLEFPIKISDLPIAIPDDVRRIASPTTSYTIKGGFLHQWKQVKHAVNFVGKTRGLFEAVKRTTEEPKDSEIQRRFSALSDDMLKARAVVDLVCCCCLRVLKPSITKESMPGKRGSQDRRGSVTFWMEDRPHCIASHSKAVDKVQARYENIEKYGITSKELGKINYKSKQRHKISNINTEIKWIDKNAIVYSNLPWSKLENPIKPEIPDYITSLSRFANKVIERKRILSSLTGRQPSVTSHRPNSSRNSLSIDSHGSSRQSSASSQKTKRVNFLDVSI